MEGVLQYLHNETTLLFQWQTLIGAFLGVLGAFFVGLIGFIGNHFYIKYKDIRESIRLTEISLAIVLNDIYDIEKNLQEFLGRLNKIVIEPLRRCSNTNQYFLNETNFPSSAVYIDPALVHAKHGSYYVHNKILIMYKNLKGANATLSEMKINYKNIIQKAELLVERGATTTNQNDEYLRNNESFYEFVSEAINQLQKAKKHLAEIKVYNLKLLEKRHFQIWCLEGVSFKYFKNKKELEEYKSSLTCLDRIDKVISDEVVSIMEKAEERLNDNG